MSNENFRQAILDYLDREQTTQFQLALAAGISQGSLSRFLRIPQREMKLSTVIKLWPIIYKAEFPKTS